VNNLTYLSFLFNGSRRAELREKLTATWHNLEQSLIDWTVDQWRKRLRTCVKAKSGHFEYQL